MLNHKRRIEALEARARLRKPPLPTRTLPTGKSMAGRALARLILGERLTHRSFDHAAHTYRLSSPIERLRNYCRWDIADTWLNAPTNDPGRRARFKEYYLDAPTMATITPKEREWARGVIRAEAA